MISEIILLLLLSFGGNSVTAAAGGINDAQVQRLVYVENTAASQDAEELSDVSEEGEEYGNSIDILMLLQENDGSSFLKRTGMIDYVPEEIKNPQTIEEAVAAEQNSTAASPAPASTGFSAASLTGSGAGSLSYYKSINSDVRAWIKVPLTNINYPVVIGPNNNYYLSLGYDKQYSRNGVIWAASPTKFGNSSQISKNTVLFGHNWTNIYTPRVGDPSDVMFAQLPGYHYLWFTQQRPYIYYTTESETMIFKVFACFYTETAFNYILENPTADQQTYIINEAKRRSLHSIDVDVDSSDKLLTLSTCTRYWGKSAEQRFVVMARLLRPGEDTTEVTMTSNPNYKRPSL